MDVIRVKDVWKKYRIYHDKGSTLKEKLLFKNRNKYEDKWVLKGIDLTIKKGETVGLIGENGSGKSTLLKLLTKIIYPNKGEIEIKGKVSSLLELGAGFHPDMTGRENIYINASIFGLTKEEIDKKIDDIIAFSELEEFIDNPVRTYSSGMYMRLAFSVAINVDADILLIDEILAVGDANFQAKCFNKMQELKNQGITTVIVSHDLGAIEKLCNKSVWIDKGIVRAIGDPYDVDAEYLDFMGKKRRDFSQEKSNQDNLQIQNNIATLNQETTNNDLENQQEQNLRWGNKDIEITSVYMTDSKGQKLSNFKAGEKVIVNMEYVKNKNIHDIVFGVAIIRNDGVHCYGTNTMIDKIQVENINKKGVFKFVIKELNLVEGEYWIDVAVHSQDHNPYDFIRKAKRFTVYSNIKDVGVCKLNHEWYIDNKILVERYR
jgi:ABC-2 type transport system ATP-binding protein